MKTLMVVSILVVLCGRTVADTIHVPADHPTIQEAIDAAEYGDTVLVAPGTYVENIDFFNKVITVRSTHGAEATIIDGGNPPDPDHGSVVTFNEYMESDTVLDGFTITNGKGTHATYHPYSGYWGGGIFCDNESSPTISNNIISDNAETLGGGGIFCIGNSEPLIIDNTISENSAWSFGGGICCISASPNIEGNNIYNNTVTSQQGGGIYCKGTDATIANNVISDNTARTYGGGIYYSQAWGTISGNIITGNESGYDAGGGGICCEDAAPHILDNLISGNTADFDGGGIFCHDSEPLIESNTIRDNTAGWGGGIQCERSSLPVLKGNRISNNSASYGAAIHCTNDTTMTLMNNIIDENRASVHGGAIDCRIDSIITLINDTIVNNGADVRGGGIHCNQNSSITITNAIFWDNTAPTGPELHIGSIPGTSTVSMNHCDVEGGQASVYLESGCTLNWGSGMIDADPMFIAGIGGDYHITYNSPCRNAGDDTAVTEAFDFEDDPRIALGAVDMGADEFHTHFYCTGDFAPNGAINGVFVGLPGTSPMGLFLGSGELDPPFHHRWGDFHLEAPWFLIPLGVSMPADGFLSIPANLPPTPAAPYDVYMQALIGLNSDSLTNLFVIEVR